MHTGTVSAVSKIRWVGWILAGVAFIGTARAAEDKFIPTFTIKYCSAGTGVLSTEETAKFDLLVVSPSHHRVWGESGMNSWESLKAYNPDMIIVLYALGPGKYNNTPWGQMGAGWEWMKQNHGADAGADRWTGSGLVHDYLANSDYANERMMYLGHPDWQDYWHRTLVADLWDGALGDDHTGASGIFADCTGYEVTNTNKWYQESHVGDDGYRDHPADYYHDDAYDHARWKTHMNEFFAQAVPALGSRGLVLVPNFGRMATHPEYWTELAAQPHPPHAAMEEAGFVKSYGSETYNYHEWPQKVAVMSGLGDLAVLMTCHGKQLGGAEGLARMDLVGTDGATGWEALWLAMTSFLLALNEEKTNGYLGFTIWGYCEYHWLDEFDPAFLHLGAPLGERYQDGDIHLREYEDGWVAANPTASDVTGVAVPAGEARILNHGNFKDADNVQPVGQFHLPAHRGVVLLKPGHEAGNQDNLDPGDDGEPAGGDDGGVDAGHDAGYDAGVDADDVGDDGGGPVADDGEQAVDDEPADAETDAGVVTDDGPDDPVSGSCGCSGDSGPGSCGLLLLVLLGAFLRKPATIP